MAQQLKCFRLLSLEEIALRKLAATLWTDSDILDSLEKLSDCEIGKKRWESIVDRIRGEIMKLKLPDSLTKQMVDLIRPIGMEIKKWEVFHVKTFDFSFIKMFEQYPAKLSFTMAGTVDYRRMAREVVLCDKISVEQRYKMACSYWLEDYIPLIWQELSEEDKEHFSPENCIARGLEYAWPCTFQEGLDRTWRKSFRCPMSFNQYAFEISAAKGYETTVKCFSRKLLREEAETSTKRIVGRAARAVFTQTKDMSKRCSNVLYYFLSLMTPLQQLEIVQAHPVSVLSCFLDFPRQDLFLENAGLVSPYLTLDQCVSLFNLEASREVIWDNGFPKFFSDFFKHCSSHFKDYFVDHKSGVCAYLWKFFHSGDAESIKAIFRSLDSANRVNLLFRDQILNLFYNAMLEDRWDLVRLCLQEAMLPEKERERLSETFRDYMNTELSFLQNQDDQIYNRLNSFRMCPERPPLIYFFNFLNEPSTSPEQEKKGQKHKLED